ncbi:MAG: hypothetical protein MZW92_77890 [Comamonadaceae bacterium]|nr:hypothetical protein [Comamonadaceae bacterium]
MTETPPGAAPLADDPELQRYVNALGTWIAQQSERADLPWSFAVNNSPVVNAVAAPGGNVIVTTGMLRVLRSESEAGGRARARGRACGSASTSTRSARARWRGSSARPRGPQRAACDQELVSSLIGPTKELGAKGLDRSDEFEADRMGVALAARAGLRFPGGCRPRCSNPSTRSRRTTTQSRCCSSTHPAPSARLDKLGVSMGTQFDDLGGPLKAERYHRATQRIRAAAG